MKRLVLLGILAGFAGACGDSPHAYNGHYVYGGEVETFQPCGSDRVYWVRGPVKILGELRESHRELTDRPYQEIYVEMTGAMGPKASDGFPAQYDGQFLIESVAITRAATADDCGD